MEMTMSSTQRKMFLMLAISLIAVGCDSVAQYSGDGKLVDNGPSAATDRYVLDLGPVSLKTPTSATFKLQNLPKENFVIGIELRAPGGSAIDQSTITPVVSIALLEDGKALITKEAKLSDWTWSVHSPGTYAFVYGRGQPGTYFTPVSGKRYELTLKVKEPDRGAASYTASLVAKSGGWK
jgi:hypothetical protein